MWLDLFGIISTSESVILGLNCSSYRDALACDTCTSLPKAFFFVQKQMEEEPERYPEMATRWWWAGILSMITEGGLEGWGLKTELEQISFPANETVGQDAGNVLRRFVLRSMVEEKSSI